MILMLLVGHSQSFRGLKGCGITAVVLSAGICSPGQGGQQQGWAWAHECRPGTWQGLFCPALQTSGVLSLVPTLPTGRARAGSTARHPAPGAVRAMSHFGHCQASGPVLPHENTTCGPHGCPYLKHSQEGLREVVKCAPPGLHLIKVKLAPKELHPQEGEDDDEEEEKQQEGGNGAH